MKFKQSLALLLSVIFTFSVAQWIDDTYGKIIYSLNFCCFNYTRLFVKYMC